MIRRFGFFSTSLVAAIGVLLATGCEDSPTGLSGPGLLHVTLVSPNSDDGAVVLELSGGSTYRSFVMDFGEVFAEQDGNTTRVVAVKNDPGTIVFRMRAEDVGDLPTVTVVQVAAGNNDLRASVSGYSVEFLQVPDVIDMSERTGS